ncbi:hypothetical protein B0J17DRAFT_628121 [Rhizoctonia solani]|nr:hypothetical protein B0J17DRAFT_628121 [Rhizoctonia solani]
MCFPFSMVYYNALASIPDQIPPLLVAIIECVWKTLGKASSGITLRKGMPEVFDYAVNTIMCMCSVLLQGKHLEKSRSVAVTVWTKLLREVNLLELVGRLCSIAVVGSSEGLLISHEQFEDLAKSIRHFMNNLKDFAQISELRDLEDLCHIWHKVLHYIDLQLSIYPLDGPIWHRIRVCRSIWFDVRVVFMFKPVPYQQHRCMKPGCPDPFLNVGAQHWDSTFTVAHSQECVGLSAQYRLKPLGII